MLVSNRLTACLFQQLLGQASVTLAPSLMRLLAGRISSDRRVPRTKIPSAQLTVVPRSENTRTSLGRSRMALFEGAFNVQVKKSDSALKKLRYAWTFKRQLLISSVVSIFSTDKSFLFAYGLLVSLSCFLVVVAVLQATVYFRVPLNFKVILHMAKSSAGHISEKRFWV